ncbi:MAG: protease modulator HflC [Fusobacteriaceae bacterium]|jgi:membrane protease subunit HflC|nr:protease modulator HflC [Fusobacteriaceae bacterium]
MKKMTNIVIGLVALIIIMIFISFTSVVITKENEYTLIIQMGEVTNVIAVPGISFKVPFIQNTGKLPKEILLYDLATSDVITKDKKTMITDSYILWRIEDPQKFAKSLNLSAFISDAERRIEVIVYNSVKTVISSMDQNDVINSRDGALQDAIEKNISDGAKEYGIKILSVETKRLDLPADNKAAVYDRMISERAKIATTYTAEGASEARVIENSTEREINIRISDATAKAASIIAEGEREYMQIIAAAYSDNSRQEFYSYMRALEAARNSMKSTGKANTLILPKDSPIADIFMKRR